MRNSKVITARPFTVKEFQEMNNGIYLEANKRYSDDHLFRKFFEEICKMMEVVRKDDLKKISSQSARIYSWWNAIGNRFNLDLEEALWYKYPGVCPYCLRDANCLCAIEHPDIPDKEQSLRRLRMERSRQPKTLSEHQLLHKTLYGPQNKRIMVIQIAAHLAEEAGEVSSEDRHKDTSGLCDEMADVASWLFALANRCDFDLSTAVWEQYPYECERCHNSPCIDKCSRVGEDEETRQCH